MMHKIESEQILKDSFLIFSFAIQRQPHGHHHCGCLFADDDGNISFLHLAWNYDLRCDPVPEGYYWNNIEMLPSHKKYLAGLCGCIQDKHPDVPYGLDPNGISFNEDGSINIISDSGTGLTCATFILTLLKCYGFLLLDEKTWPTQKDEKTQRTIIIGLQRIPPQATQEKIVQNTNCIGMRFFYPNEVVGASLCNEKEWPVAYERAEELARIVNTYTDSEVLAIPKS